MVIVQFANGKYAIKTDSLPGWWSFNFYQKNSELIWTRPDNVHFHCTYDSAQEAAEHMEKLKGQQKQKKDMKKFKVIK